jgi:branched-chain amino acid transport system permease protein
MEQLIQALWAGILFGSVYGLMAVGLTLIWGALNLLNLAHGALYMCTAYIAWALIAQAGLPIFVAFPLSLIAAGVIGAILYFSVVRPMLGRPGFSEASWIATVGAATVIQGVVLIIFGGQVRVIPNVLSGSFLIGQVVITYQGLVVVVISMVTLVLLGLFLSRSRHGMSIRAVSQQIDAARLMGIPADRVFLLVMMVSAALAGLAGILLSSILFLQPSSGFLPLIKALIVTILGGLGSVKGTIIAAFMVGTLEAFVATYIGVGSTLPALFLFIIAVLIVRPNGLFGSEETQRL